MVQSIRQVVGGSLVVAVGLVFLALVVALTGGLVMEAWEAKGIQDRAVSTDATVLNSTVTRVRDCDNERDRTDCDVTWDVQVRYAYTADGERYRSSVIHAPSDARESFGEKAEAQAYAAQYSENATVGAYYVPGDPDTAFLERHDPFSLANLGVPVVVLAFSVVPLAFVVLGGAVVREGL